MYVQSDSITCSLCDVCTYVHIAPARPNTAGAGIYIANVIRHIYKRWKAVSYTIATTNKSIIIRSVGTDESLQVAVYDGSLPISVLGWHEQD